MSREEKITGWILGLNTVTCFGVHRKLVTRDAKYVACWTPAVNADFSFWLCAEPRTDAAAVGELVLASGGVPHPQVSIYEISILLQGAPVAGKEGAALGSLRALCTCAAAEGKVSFPITCSRLQPSLTCCINVISTPAVARAAGGQGHVCLGESDTESCRQEPLPVEAPPGCLGTPHVAWFLPIQL